jgi:PKD domain
MKTKQQQIMRSLSKLMIPLFVVVAATLIVSCGDDAPKIESPRAIFDFVVNTNRSGQVSFTSESLRADSYSWDFGDLKGTSTEQNPSYTYTKEGTYKVTLTVKNAGGENSANLDVTVFIGAAELIKDGDMSKATSWTTKQLWINPENAVLHAIKDGVFFMDNAPGTNYSQYLLWQEVTIPAGKQHIFSADIASTLGLGSSVWVEVYFSKVDPNTSDKDNDYPKGVAGKTMRLNFRELCGKTAFNGKIQTLAQSCQESSSTFNMGADGKFTLAAGELNTNGKIFVVFKIGTWDDSVNFKDGMTLDNVSIKEVL